MKIKTKLKLIIIVNILILAGLVSLSLLWQKQTDKQYEQQSLVMKLNLAIFERARLREEYFIYGSDRSKEQFLLMHKKIGELLAGMPGTFTGPGEKVHLNKMTGFHIKIGDLFGQVVRLDESAMGNTAATQALRQRIISQMLVNAHSMYRETSKLLQSANEKTVHQINLARLYSNIFFGLLGLFVVSFTVIIIRSVAHPLTRLQRGTEMIARGDLDYKTNLRTPDEIGQLSTAFDLMTENLKKITVSRYELSKEVEMRVMAEDTLRALTSRQEAILTAVPEIIMEVDNNKVYTWANSTGIEFFGEDVIGKEASFYFEGEQDTYDKVNPLFNGAEDMIHVESWQRRKDGQKRLLGWWCRALKDEDGNITGVLSSARDITERKQAEEELKESKALIESVVENVPLMIFLKEATDLRFVMFNRAGEELLGYDRRDLIGKNNLDLFPPEQAAHFMAKDREVLDGEAGMLDIPEEPILTAKKGQRLLHTRKVCIRGFDGATKFLLGISEDITERKRAEEELQRTLESLRKAVGTTIQVMVSAVEVRDPYTAGHQVRSADLARAIATEMGLPQEKIDGIRMAGSIHDIGKLSIPAEILSKPTKLTEIEFSLIKEHSRSGYEMLKDVESSWPLAEIVYQHHERMNGTGYPRNLKGDDILMEARILAVSDVVESMASHRPYRPALGIDAALEEIVKNKGILYDNTVADVCLKLFREKGFQLEGT